MNKKITWYGGNCLDCKGPNEPYMVVDSIWNSALSKKENKHGTFVCLSCLESRLDRKLTKKDFTNVPINNGCFGFHWKYWINRKNYAEFFIKCFLNREQQ